jgi:hypothetical protein
VKLIVKVDPKRAKDPAKYVSELLRGAGDSGNVEEVFPGLRSGSSAGLVSVNLPAASSAKARRTTLKALQDDEAVAYVEQPKRRRPLQKK